MPTRRLLLLCALAACAFASLQPAAGAAEPPRSTLAAYRNEAEMVDALTRWRREAAKLRGGERRSELGAAQADAAPAAPAAAESSLAKSADAREADSITNVQTAGVDEGGIVKRAGDHLVILRRGRLFTVRVGGDSLQPAAMLDAYAPGSNPGGAWYDELLISGSTVVVVGYSYARGGTEIGLFELGSDGSLAYRATYHLRSYDYYSSRNYASRLVGSKLIFYTPTLLHPSGPPPWQTLPGLRRWQGDTTPHEWERILPATRVFRTDDDFDPREPLALHTITACELGAAPLRCESTAVLGPAGRVFYVSQGSVYVWTSAWRRRHVPPPSPWEPPQPMPQSLSAVFRIPLDFAAPTAIKTAGVPIDQMSFLEDGGGHLNVLLRESGAGEGHVRQRTHARRDGAAARAAVGVRRRTRRRTTRTLSRAASAQGHSMQNRFVGDWLLWGGLHAGARGAMPLEPRASAWALRYAERGEPQALAPGHAVERIEAMGRDAVLVGNAGADLHFSSVRLDHGSAELAGRHVQVGASQGETRTHGFFFRPTGNGEGLLGLPVLGHGARSRYGVYGGAHGSAAVLYLRQRDLAFSALGHLQAQAVGGARRRLQGVMRRLVRQRAADLSRRPRVRAARLRAGRRTAHRRPLDRAHRRAAAHQLRAEPGRALRALFAVQLVS